MGKLEKIEKKSRVQDENLTPGGPGRPKGQRNYATIYREALKKIADTQGMTPDELEELMLQSGLKKAIKGDYSFYKDTMDRLHGKSVQPIDLIPDKQSNEKAEEAIASFLNGRHQDKGNTKE